MHYIHTVITRCSNSLSDENEPVTDIATFCMYGISPSVKFNQCTYSFNIRMYYIQYYFLYEMITFGLYERRYFVLVWDSVWHVIIEIEIAHTVERRRAK